MSEGHEDLVSQFREITGVDNERARFYLEASGWQLQLATQSFFEGDGEAMPEDMVQDNEDSDPEVDAETRQRLEQNLQGMLRQMMPGGLAAAAAGGGKPKIKKSKKPAGPKSGVMTLGALKNQESEEESSEEEDKGQAFYAGGSQSSGQQVLGPPRRRDELVAEMFRRAREAGAQEVEGPPQMIKKKSATGGGAFSGAGYKLGDTNEGAEAVGASSSNTNNANTDSSQVEVVLRLWSNGFTVNDGPLRQYQDPANMDFLSSVKRGEVPRELIREYQGREIDMTMEDKRHEDYVPPKNQPRAFTGKGHSLGSPAPAVVGTSGSLSDADKKAGETAAREQIPLMDGAPTTNIQFRLADGSRLVARFNLTHTVNDLHSYINVARPQYASVNYVLTLFPNTELTDKSQTIESAKLSNSALIQKIKQ